MLERLVDWRRSLNLAGFAVCAALIAGAYYFQFVEGMEPCPLCIFQRVAVFALGLVFLAASLHGPRGAGSRVYGLAVLLVAGTGAALAIRHLWIQSLPADQVPACGPGLNYMLDTFPLWDTVKMVLRGSGECAHVDRVFGVTFPAWTLAAFVLLGVAGVLLNWPVRRRGLRAA